MVDVLRTLQKRLTNKFQGSSETLWWHNTQCSILNLNSPTFVFQKKELDIYYHVTHKNVNACLLKAFLRLHQTCNGFSGLILSRREHFKLVCLQM